MGVHAHQSCLWLVLLLQTHHQLAKLIAEAGSSVCKNNGCPIAFLQILAFPCTDHEGLCQVYNISFLKGLRVFYSEKGCSLIYDARYRP